MSESYLQSLIPVYQFKGRIFHKISSKCSLSPSKFTTTKCLEILQSMNQTRDKRLFLGHWMPHDKIVNLTLISQKFKNIGICHFSLALSQITLKQRNFQKTQIPRTKHYIWMKKGMYNIYNTACVILQKFLARLEFLCYIYTLPIPLNNSMSVKDLKYFHIKSNREST